MRSSLSMLDRSTDRAPILAYLSGAPRVTTLPDAGAPGPRAHVLGVIDAFHRRGWDVWPYIAGDSTPRRWLTPESERSVARSRWLALAADVGRLALGRRNRGRSARALPGRPDLVYERFGLFQSLGEPFRKRGIPWVLETNGFYTIESKQDRDALVLGRIARRLEVRAYRRCDVLICISERLRDLVVREAGIDPAKVLVIPNGVDPAWFDPALHEPARRAPGLVIGFVGHLLEWHGLDLLLHAIKTLADDGVPVSAVIIGDGPERGRLEALANDLGIDARFAGQVPRTEIPGCIAGFDLGFAGSLPLAAGEMYRSPLKLYEYLSMARPVVASGSEDDRRLVIEGRTGFAFEPGDRDGLIDALRRAVAMRERLPAMGAEGRAHIVAGHSWDARVDQTLRGVREILAGRS